MVVEDLRWGRILELLFGSLVLPALVAFLITHWRMNRQSIQEKQNWYDSVEAAASRIERAWYRENELTKEKRNDTIRTVESSLGDLKEFKGNPEAGGKLVDSIELLNRRWLHHKADLQAKTAKQYRGLSDSIKRDCRQIKYIVQTDRPKPLHKRFLQKLPNPLEWYRHCRKMGFILSRKRLSNETVEYLEVQMTLEEIKQLESGEKSIRITSPFSSRLLVTPGPNNTHFSVNAFFRIHDDGTDIRKSFRVFPIPEEAIREEMGLAQEWELEDLAITRGVVFEEMGMYNTE